MLSLHAERWTRRDPFQFRIDAKGAGDWQEIHQDDKEVKVGGFHTEIRLALPEGSRTIAVTKDLGETWDLHPTDRSALREPVCMASLFRWEHPERGDLIFFSNPDTTRGRHDMTIKLSRDQALTWIDSDARLYDSRACFGYSCLAPSGPDHIGVLYEGKSSMLYLRLPLDEWFE